MLKALGVKQGTLATWWISAQDFYLRQFNNLGALNSSYQPFYHATTLIISIGVEPHHQLRELGNLRVSEDSLTKILVH